MESLLKVFDDTANQINNILEKGGSDWVVRHQKGMAISWELTPALARIEAELSTVDKTYMSEQDYEELLAHHIERIFHLDLHKLYDKEIQKLMNYVSGYIEGEAV